MIKKHNPNDMLKYPFGRNSKGSSCFELVNVNEPVKK